MERIIDEYLAAISYAIAIGDSMAAYVYARMASRFALDNGATDGIDWRDGETRPYVV